MACRAIRSWTLPSLVGAYLDLALAYLFLSAAALAFVASKFLALFGLSLPCSCRPGDPGCLPSLLADYPDRKVAGVHVAVRGRFPFDSACRSHPRRRRCCCYDAKLASEDGVKDDDLGVAARGLLEMGGGEGGGGGGGGEDESCGSVSKPSASSKLSLPAPAQLSGAESGNYFGTGQMSVVKGKEILRSETPPAVLHHRRRRRNSLVIRGKSQWASLTPPQLQLRWETKAAIGTPFSCEVQQQAFQVNPSPVLTGAGDQLSGSRIGLVERVASSAERKSIERDGSCGIKQICGSKENESTIVRDLKQAIEEERSAGAVLCLELEKERSAAATAADEAMAMILRLQEEKAAVEMEARQFQRMVEEKSAYDEEEMEILKEIILRREKEKHVLEKEVEAYRTMILAGSGVQQPLENYLVDVAQPMGEIRHLSFDVSDDPELTLKEIYKSIEKKEKVKDKMQHLDDCEPLGSLAVEKQNFITCFDNGPLSLGMHKDAGCSSHGDIKQVSSVEKFHLDMPDHGDECNVQDKSMVTMEVLPSSLQKERTGYGKESILNKLGNSGETGIHELTSHSNNEHGARNRKMKTEVSLKDLCTRHGLNTVETCIGSSQFETDAHVLDVHVIDAYNMTNAPSTTNTVGLSTPDSDTRWRPFELNIHRSCSDMTKTARTMDGSCQRASWLDLRRSSMSAVDSERFKLENEVELLRKRLKLIQQEREKLNLPAEQREKESYHLQLLEEITCQLQEIRKSAEPGTSKHQSSLPPPSSKVNLRKRRHSVSGVPHDST